MTSPDPDHSSKEAPSKFDSRDFFAMTIAAFQVLWIPIALMLLGFFLAYAIGWLWFGGGASWLWSLVTGGSM